VAVFGFKPSVSKNNLELGRKCVFTLSSPLALFKYGGEAEPTDNGFDLRVPANRASAPRDFNLAQNSNSVIQQIEGGFFVERLGGKA
jgi:hypothetical protein